MFMCICKTRILFAMVTELVEVSDLEFANACVPVLSAVEVSARISFRCGYKAYILNIIASKTIIPIKYSLLLNDAFDSSESFLS